MVPNIPCEVPESMGMLGMQILQEWASKTPEKGIINPLILTSTKIEGLLENNDNSLGKIIMAIPVMSHLVMLNGNSKLIYNIIFKSDTNRATPRRLLPNLAADTVPDMAMEFNDFLKGLFDIWGSSPTLVCWNAEFECEAMTTAFPAIQMMDLAQSRTLFHTLRFFFQKERKFTWDLR